MSLAIPTRTVESVYRNIVTMGRSLGEWLPGWISQCGGVYSALLLTETIIPRLVTCAQTFPPSSLFSADWQARLAAYANTQVEVQRTTEDYIAAFDATGNAVRAALAAAIAELPMDGSGYVLVLTYSASGAQQWRTLGPSQDLVAALEAAQATLD